MADNNQPRKLFVPQVIMGSIPSGMSSDYGEGGSYPISQYFQAAEGKDDALMGFDVYKLYKYGRFADPQHFFAYWDTAHNVNPWYRFSLDYVTSQIFTNYHFEGSGAPQVEEAWKEHNLYKDIRILGEATGKYGTGIGKKIIDTFENQDYGTFGGIQTMYTPDFQVTKDDKNWNEEWEYRGNGPKLTDTWVYGEKYMNDLVILRPWTRPERVWGFSPMQSCVHVFESLHALTIEDLPAACRNFMTAQRVYKVNTDNVEEDDVKSHIEDGIAALSQFNSARASAVAIDDANSLFYMGTEGGGGIGSKLEDVMSFIEPITSAMNLNFYFPIGALRQEGANRAIIKRQAWIAFEQMAAYKQYFADEMFRQIIEPHIDYDGEVRLVHDLPFEMRESQIEDAVNLYVGGIVPREYAQVMVGFDEDEFRKKFGITGELTYAEDVTMEIQEEGLKLQAKVAAKAAKAGATAQGKTGTGKDTRQENEKGEEQNDSVSGSESEVKG